VNVWTAARRDPAGVVVTNGAGDRATRTITMTTTAADLLRMNGAELDELFETRPAGPLPTGRGAGTAVMAPGTIWARPLAGITRVVAWQGREFGVFLRSRRLPVRFSLAFSSRADGAVTARHESASGV
jgi:hypothetical protein